LLCRCLRKPASWLLTSVIESFAEYGNATHPGLYQLEQYAAAHAQTMEALCLGQLSGQHEDKLRLTGTAFKGDAVVKWRVSAGLKMVFAVVADRSAGMAARLVKFWARWRREAETSRQAALLSSFSDHLLRDIGVARDQTDSYTHRESPAFGAYRQSPMVYVLRHLYAARP
jgi:uncharacterized protein YjiS (DUF1127 family)